MSDYDYETDDAIAEGVDVQLLKSISSIKKNKITLEKMKVEKESAAKALEIGWEVLQSVEEEGLTEEQLKTLLLGKVTELGWKNGQLLWPLRVALSGEEFSPGTFELLGIFGKERSLFRIGKGREILAAG